ncbi:hypothetical protein HU200_022291 [Digitaria exilis]|uniref:Aminotransferase class I/classII large domain-containing protein n=1 Tax=Digitaria exilis TaxID=1010633 RepID=A0A835EYR7_9POAL|nr:hypothetical protein HU200_022291 [Digitaria exilis]
MERRLSAASRRSAPSAIQQLSHLAQRVGAVNLAEGFPDFPAPPHVKAAASAAIAADLNQYSPHNPTGKVFSKEELLIISRACEKMDCFAITDEVYEYITYDENKHISLASLPGMQERTIITSSLSKTYSVTDSAPAPFQEAALTALTSTPDFYSSLKKDYVVRRDFILKLLDDFGLRISFKPQGSVFVFAELPRSWQLSDIIRMFAFCKGDETLMTAALRMRKLADGTGRKSGLLAVADKKIRLPLPLHDVVLLE